MNSQIISEAKNHASRELNLNDLDAVVGGSVTRYEPIAQKVKQRLASAAQ